MGFFEFLYRWRLQQKGHASGRKRLQERDTPLLDWFEEGRTSRWLICLAFLGIVSGMLLAPGPGGFGWTYEGIQRVLMTLVIFAASLVYFYVGHPEEIERNGRIALAYGVILMQLFFVKGLELLVNALEGGQGLLFILVPAAFAPMLLRVLLGRRFGMFAVTVASLLTALLVKTDLRFEFVVSSLIGGAVAIYVMRRARHRRRLVQAGIYVGVTNLILALALGQITFAGQPLDQTLYQILAALLVGLVTATLVGGLLPIFEGLFQLTTDMSWIEMADLNHPLLRRLTIEAPGTYHHSLVVAQLAEAAAEKIGANPIECRVCSYFHDIGKLQKPLYFIENQGDGVNPHDELTPTMSSLIIIAHVKEGVDLAIRNKLNPQIMDAIREHHGDSLVGYFYQRARKQQEEAHAKAEKGEISEDDVPRIEESNFRYPGPRPKSKETAIISLADAVESASRSLGKPSPSRIRQLIDDIFQGRIADGQLDDAPLTMAELKLLKESFSSNLRSMLHHRVPYPKEPGEAKSTEPKAGAVTQRATKETSRSAA
ncbi:MAG: HDIG domain-containing metalloprotein [Verrucomicrobiota bacterium]